MLDGFTVEQLRAELRKREAHERELAKPKQIDPNIEPLRRLCQVYIDSVANDAYDEELEHYIFEAAMVCFYGENVWIFINRKLK